MFNFIENKAAQGKIGSGENQKAAVEASIKLQKETLIADQERRLKVQEERKDNLVRIWDKGFHEGLKRKVNLVRKGEGWTYRLTIGSGHKAIIGSAIYLCPIRAIEAGYRKQSCIYKVILKGE